mmetsp:Transcript_10972/g.31097  ORF Transcript_10972/g.31097 Transcript_10972/m.31097 type:complete len:280 (+) Transcript_10972:1252-2091(+)
MPRNQNIKGIIGSHTNAVANAPFDANVEMAGDTAENSTFAFSSFGINCTSFGNRLVWYLRFMYFCCGGRCFFKVVAETAASAFIVGFDATNDDDSFTSKSNLVVPSSNLTFVTSPFCTAFKNVEYATLFTAGAGGCRFACSRRRPAPLPIKNAADNTNFATRVFSAHPIPRHASTTIVFITTRHSITRRFVNSISEKFLRRLVSIFSSSVSSEKECITLSDGTFLFSENASSLVFSVPSSSSSTTKSSLFRPEATTNASSSSYSLLVVGTMTMLSRRRM